MNYLISSIVLFYVAYAPPPPLTRSPVIPKNLVPAVPNTQIFPNMIRNMGRPAFLPMPIARSGGPTAAIQMSATGRNQMASGAISRVQPGNPTVLNAQGTSGNPASASAPGPLVRTESSGSLSSFNSIGSTSSSASSVPTVGSLVRKILPPLGLLAVAGTVAGVYGHEAATKNQGSP